MFHDASLSLGGRTIALTFDQQKQNLVDSLRFKDGSSLKEIPHGKGRIFWAAYPVELTEGTDAAAALYSYVAVRVGIAPMFDASAPLPAGVMIFPTVLQDSVLYVLSSERADDTKIDLHDKLTGTRLTLQLKGQHAALALIGKQQKSVVAKYGF